MTPTQLEAELRWYWVESEEALGMCALALEAMSSTGYHQCSGLAQPQLNDVRRERRIRFALCPLPAYQRGILAACYSPVSQYVVGPDERATDRPGKRQYGLIDGLCRAKTKAEKDLVHHEVDAAHEAFFRSWHEQAEFARAELRAARAAGEAKRAAMLARITRERNGRDAWADDEVAAWKTEIGLVDEGEAA